MRKQLLLLLTIFFLSLRLNYMQRAIGVTMYRQSRRKEIRKKIRKELFTR